MNETITFQVTATLPNGARLTQDFDSQSDARTFYTTEVENNTDGRVLTLTQTTSTTKFRIHVSNKFSTEYSVIGSFLTQDEAETAIAEDEYLSEMGHAYIVKYVSSTVSEATTV